MDEIKENENLEQPAVAGSNEFGKFKDANSLLKAYNNLESEFTKKSQRLAFLEAENTKTQNEILKREENERKVDELVNKFEQIKPFSSALKESLNTKENCDLYEEAFSLISKNYKKAEDFAHDEEFLNNYIFSNNQIKEKILKDYVKNITQNSVVQVDAGFSSVSLTPPRVPKTIKEAGMMAKSIIKQK